MSFFSLGDNAAGSNAAGTRGGGDDDADNIDIFPDEYTIQKHIGNAWAGDPLAQVKAIK